MTSPEPPTSVPATSGPDSTDTHELSGPHTSQQDTDHRGGNLHATPTGPAPKPAGPVGPPHIPADIIELADNVQLWRLGLNPAPDHYSPDEAKAYQRGGTDSAVEALLTAINRYAQQ